MSNPYPDDAPILVIGANGKTGSRVATRLHGKERNVRACSRSTQPRFDWNDRSTWNAALKGAQSAYVTYQPDLAVPGALETISAFYDAALAQGVDRIVLLSGRGEEEAEAAERALKASSARWTILRCSWFMQNFSESFLLGPIREGTLALPVSAIGEPFVDADDIADVAVAALTQAGHEGQLYELTGPRALTFAQAAECIARATQRNINVMPISNDAFRDGLLGAGVSKQEVDLIRYLFATVLDGRNERPADGVRRALKRDPHAFEDYVRLSAASGIWNA